MKGMDICYRQGDIDFQKAHADGIDFIIPRDGWGTSSTDPKLIEYCQKAQKAGISVPGVFHFIYAVNLQEAVANADCAVRNVQKAGLPKSTVIWCDLEYDTVNQARDRGVTLTQKDQRAFAEAFCNFVLAQGYPTGIYLNADYLCNVYGRDIADDYDIWLADLEGKADYPCLYRQYDWYAHPAGCPTNVDLDEYVGTYTAGTAKPKGSDKLKASTLLTQIHDVVDTIPTVYEQGANWGAWNGSAFRLDCIIFVKCMVYWDWYYPDKNKAHGGAQYDPGTDWTEINILNHCSHVSYKDFLAAKPCEYLYMDGHGGFKIDEFTRNGKTYNAAECTWGSAWGTPAKCVYSYVDDAGYRYNYKGGTPSGKWEAHGELAGVEYDDIPVVPKTTHELALEVIAGKWGNGQDRRNRLAAAGYDYAIVQAEVERILAGKTKQPTSIPLERFINCLPTIQKNDTGAVVKVLQNCLTILGYYTDAVDGSAGPNTITAIKAYQTAAGISPDGSFGPESWARLLKQ